MSGVLIEVDGGVLQAIRAGAGEPALIFHGGPGLSDYTAALAAELAPVLATVRYQQRGLPPSTQAGPFTVEQHVADAACVLDQLALERVWLLGHSWGGILALLVAVAHPERLQGLIVLSTIGVRPPDGGWKEGERNVERRLALLAAARVARIHELEDRVEKGAASEEEQDEFVNACWPLYFSEPSRYRPSLLTTRFRVGVLAETKQSLLAELSAQRLLRQLPTLETPTLFLHGTADPWPWRLAADTASLIPNACFRLLDDCGHFPWLEQPGRVAAEISEFVAAPANATAALTTTEPRR